MGLLPQIAKPSPGVPRRFQIRDLFVMLVLFLIVLTILSLLVSQVTSLETIKTGNAFLILFVGVFISLIWWAGHDKKLEQNEILILIIVAIALIAAFWALKEFVPQIFSSVPPIAKFLGAAI